MLDKANVLCLHRSKCPACGESIRIGQKYEIHHGGIHNTKGNRENYPELIDSYCNLFPMHAECHARHPEHGRLPNESVVKLEKLFKQFRDVVKTVEVSPKLLIADMERIVEEEK